MAWTGQCMCGAVRYQLLSEPFDCGWCHCRTCQLNSGAPAMVFASVPPGAFQWTQGEQMVRTVRSSDFATRSFCSGCGTPFLMKVDHQPQTVDFSVATLNDPNAVVPRFHIFWSSRLSWFERGDDLPRHARFRHDRSGLGGTEPPSD